MRAPLVAEGIEFRSVIVQAFKGRQGAGYDATTAASVGRDAGNGSY